MEKVEVVLTILIEKSPSIYRGTPFDFEKIAIFRSSNGNTRYKCGTIKFYVRHSYKGIKA